MWNAVLVLLAMILCHAQTGNNRGINDKILSGKRDDYAYVSLDAELSIAVYRIDSAKGNLDFIKKIIVSGEPGALAVDPTHTVLYAAIRSTNSISSFRINRQNGDLALINTIRAAGNPVYVGTDKTGKFLLTAYFADTKAAIYPIGKDGAVGDSAVSVFVTEKNAHSIQTDPTNQYLFIPCRTGETIHQYKFSQGDGMLVPNAPDRVTTPANTGPRHFAFHLRLPIVYFVNEFGNSVTVCRLDPLKGTLTAVQTLAALPKDFAGRSSGADVHLTPDGRFLYASNRGHESIAAFSVDMATGLLAPIGHFETEKTPRSFAIEEGGQYLYAAGQGSGRIAAYRIDRSTGKLKPLRTYDAGKNPVWILTVRLNYEK